MMWRWLNKKQKAINKEQDIVQLLNCYIAKTMQDKLKIYIAGKVSKESCFGTHYWRDEVCRQLEEKIGITLLNLDPTKSNPNYHLDENNSQLKFGRDSFMIKFADIVVVYLSDDISVGGSQEMLISKYFKKPLIGIVKSGGKFKRDKELYGRLYKNWTHAFVKMTCDYIVEDTDEAAQVIKEYLSLKPKIKDISVIDQSIEYYMQEYYPHEDIYE
jgi:hypothetical protein